jgi:hypothetical protein
MSVKRELFHGYGMFDKHTLLAALGAGAAIAFWLWRLG